MSLKRFVVAGVAAYLLAPLPALAGWSNDPYVNTRLTTSTFSQANIASVADGSGGVFVLWAENNFGNWDVWGQHLTSGGLVAPGWPTAGLLVCGAAGDQYPMSAVPDGTGGFILFFDDYRNGGVPQIWAQRVSGEGALLWASGGVGVCTVAGSMHFNGRACADGAHGAVVVWTDTRNQPTNGYDLFAQRVSPTGAVMWTAVGVAVAAAAGEQGLPQIVADGSVGGSLIVWQDNRNPTLDIYGTRLDGNGFVRAGWTANGTGLCTATGAQTAPTLASDGAFGAVLVWEDGRVGNTDIFALRVNPGGAPSTGWTANGVAVTTDTGFQGRPAIATDGAGGAIVAWEDSRGGSSGDIYAQRMTSAGVASWSANGVSVAAAYGQQTAPMIVADGAGGAVIGWLDPRPGTFNEIYAQKITNAGAVASGWTINGVAVALRIQVQFPTMVSDDAGGAIFAFQYNESPQAMHAQRVDAFGMLGAQPTIADVADVPNDEGGVVKLSWLPSPLDAYPSYSIARYLVFRSVPTSVVAEALRRGATIANEWSEGAGDRHSLLVTGTGAAVEYWEYLSTQTAYHLPGYSCLAATAQDAVPAGNPYTRFMIVAQNADASRFWSSDVDSGYSTDDLAPAAPSPFTGVRTNGETALHWGASPEPDLGVYRLYRGASPDFVPGPGNLVAAPTDTGYVDAWPTASWYKLTAVDVHGNESAPVALSPGGTVDAPATARPGALWLDAARPNPMRESTRLRFALPRATFVRLTVLDGQGRLVRTLDEGGRAAGTYDVSWDGVDRLGRAAPSSMYFVRLEADGMRLDRRLLRIR